MTKGKKKMSAYRVVVDGSNLATEGRSTPSLAQLDEAVRDFMREFPASEVTVVVDASFGHRIDEAERPMFEEAVAHGEVISPPAGAVGRGDAFLLRIAERTGATVLSNDSFQEFHGDHQWLFSRGRLVGGKPVPGVGWIFTPRTPVRGARSKQAVREAKANEVRVGSAEASRPMPVPTTPPPGRRRKAGRAEGGRADKPAPVAAPPAPSPAAVPAAAPAQVQRAIADATEEALTGAPTSSRGRRRRRNVPPRAVNDPLTFIKFIAEHPLGARLEGEVERFTSHGAFVAVDGAHCYVPLSSLGDPMPRRARDLLSKGERRTFVLQALDPQRRGIELALPEFAEVSGEPKQETVDAEIAEATKGTEATKATKAAKASGAEKATKAARAAKPTEGPKATKAGKAIKADKAATKATKAKKAGKAAKPAGSPAAGADAQPAGSVAEQAARPVKKAAKKASAKKTTTSAGGGTAQASDGAAQAIGPRKRATKKADAEQKATT